MRAALSIEEVCSMTGMGRTKIYESIGAGALRAKKWGRRTLVLKTDLEAFLAELESYPIQVEVSHG